MSSAVVVWCRECKTAVWAYDHFHSVPMSRVCNSLRLPCPKCGTIANFDGWCSYGSTIEELQKSFPDMPIYDWWSALKAMFTLSVPKGVWEISPDCSWFSRPNEDPDEGIGRDLQRRIDEQMRSRIERRRDA